MTQHSSGECNVWPELRTMALGGNFSFFFFFKQLIYLFLERGEGRKKEREISMCGCLSCGPHWGPGLQPRHVP